ncbi:MAG: LysM peptidoglycan-binding domain-containing protein [Gemmatimonadales bacterium]
MMPRSFRLTWLGALALVLCPAFAQGQEPAPQTHTVRKGDTLWDLARQYRNDPFLWPDIYRLNTSVVEDPHWIYPGEVLRLDASEAVASVPSTDTPSMPDSALAAPVAVEEPAAPDPEEAPTSLVSITKEGAAETEDEMAPLFGKPATQSMQETLRAYTNQPYRPLRRSEFYSSGFLSEGERLPYGDVLGPVTPPQIRAQARNVGALPYTVLAIEAPGRATYQVGDTLLVVRTGGEIGDHGDVVIPTGMVQVVDTADGKYLAEVVAMYGTIRAGQHVLPAESFTGAGSERAVPVEQGITAHLLGGPARQELKAPQMVVFLDKGRRDGVATGDIFEIRRTPEELSDGSIRVDEVMATMQVVHVRERTATARLLRIISPDITIGATVRQVAKLPS